MLLGLGLDPPVSEQLFLLFSAELTEIQQAGTRILTCIEPVDVLARLFPTAEARALYKDSEPIFTLHAAFEARVQDIKENRAGHIRIIATPFVMC